MGQGRIRAAAGVLEVRSRASRLPFAVGMNAPVDLSVIVPAYNEEPRLEQPLLQVSDYFRARGRREQGSIKH